MVSRSRFRMSPPPKRSGPCCHQDQDPASAFPTEVKATAAAKGKTPAVNTEVKLPVAAGTKAEKSKLKEVVAAVVAGEGMEAEVPPRESPDTPEVNTPTEVQAPVPTEAEGNRFRAEVKTPAANPTENKVPGPTVVEDPAEVEDAKDENPPTIAEVPTDTEGPNKAKTPPTKLPTEVEVPTTSEEDETPLPTPRLLPHPRPRYPLLRRRVKYWNPWHM